MITRKKINNIFYNYYLGGKFYIGTVQRPAIETDQWTAQLLWDEGGNYCKEFTTMEDAEKQIYTWLDEPLP